MKLDLDLLRTILLEAEDSGQSPISATEARASDEVGYHAHLLIEAGLARGVDVTNMSSTAQQGLITGLTWAGHEFAELARDNTKWEATMAAVKAAGRPLTFDELKKSLMNPPAAVDVPKSRQFEREVAAIYRALGAQVQQDASLAGNQVDVLIEERTTSGASVKAVVECKAYSRPVGIEIVNQFVSLLSLLKERRLVDRGVIVAAEGFTRQARDAARDVVELLEITDLKGRVRGLGAKVSAAQVELEEAVRQNATRAKERPRIFVLMPFAAEFLDVYILGIREVSEKLGFTVDRADDIEHNGNILDLVEQRIRQADVVIADMSTRNPNVFYEIGYARAIGRPTVLLCRNTDEVPFDLQSINYVKYGGIVDLRERLEKRLKVLAEGQKDAASAG
jgi:hypothetical protein